MRATYYPLTPQSGAMRMEGEYRKQDMLRLPTDQAATLISKWADSGVITSQEFKELHQIMCRGTK